MLKKILIGLGIFILLLFITGFSALKIIEARMHRLLDNYPIPEVAIATIPDGVYKGKFEALPVAVELEATMGSGKLTAIKITKQSAGHGYEAKAMPDRIIAAQSLAVDAVSGATFSSKCILIALHKALTKAK